jgi:hypothetical protein
VDIFPGRGGLVPKTAAVACSVCAALGLAGTANGSPITYDYTGGAVDITGITVDGTTVLPSGSTPAITLASTSTATLDTTADTLSFMISQGAAASIPLCCSATNGKNTFSFASATFTLSNLTADSLSNLPLSGGSGSYTFNTGTNNGVTLAGTWELTGATKNGTSLGTLGPTAFGPNNKPISGSVAITANSQMLQMDGVPLGTFDIDNQAVVVTGNIIFEGASTVPVPGSAWLLTSGLGLLGLLLVRQRERWA